MTNNNNSSSEHEPSANSLHELYLYYYTRAEFLPDIIGSNRIKLTEIGLSNDPLEGMPSFSCEGMKNPESIVEMLKWESEWKLSYWRKTKKCICTSCSASSVLMWGHYAAGHTGACLVFKFTEDKPVPEAMAYARLIHYSSKRIRARNYIVLHNGKYLKNSPLLDDEVSITKSAEWAYEKEVRIFLGEECPCHIDKNSIYTNALMPYLDGIILGVKCTLTANYVETLLSKSLRNRQINIVKAKVSETENKICTDIYQDLPDEKYNKLQDLCYYGYINNSRVHHYYEQGTDKPIYLLNHHEKRLS